MATPENGNEEKGQRISVTIDPSLRRKIRIAAAYADVDVPEWCRRILEAAALKSVPEAARRRPKAASS